MRSAQGFTQDNMFMVIHGMYLEDIFRQVETSSLIFMMDTSPGSEV
jgi:hypothetical protein